MMSTPVRTPISKLIAWRFGKKNKSPNFCAAGILDDVKINSHLFISTNCSVSPSKIPIDKFKSVVINISIDGLNNVGEDVRYGLNTKRFMKNLNEWISLSKAHRDTFLIPIFQRHLPLADV